MLFFAVLLAVIGQTVGMVTPADCHNCTHDQWGNGFLHHEYCLAFYRCEPRSYAPDGYVLHEFCCPAGLVWDTERLTCNYPPRGTTCFDDAAAAGYVCPGMNEITTIVPCRFEADPADSTKFIESYSRTSYDCAPFTIWQQENCTCVHDGNPHPHCHKIINFDFSEDFDSRSCNNRVAGIAQGDAELRDNAVCFAERGWVEYNFMNNWAVDNPAAAEFTASFWFKSEGTLLQSGLFQAGNCVEVSLMFALIFNEVVVGAQHEDGMGAFFPPGLNAVATDGMWHQTALTFDGSAVSFYFDGNFTASAAVTEELVNSQSSSLIGMVEIGQPAFFKGCIDDLCIITHALSAEEVKAELFDVGRSD